jgi:Bacterial Ig-like domain (group 1)
MAMTLTGIASMNALVRIGFLAASLALVSCGGGGGSAGTCTFSPCSNTPTTPGATATAADISLAVSAPTVSNSGSATVTVTVTAVDANRNTIAGIPVTLRVDNGATVAVSAATTNAQGVVTGTVNIGSDRSNRAILVTAVSGSLTKESAVQVVGSRLTGTALPAVLAPGEAGTVQYQLVDASNNPMAGIPIVVSGPGGVDTSATSGVNGDYIYRYTAPATGSTLDIRAAAAGVQNITTILTGSVSVPPALSGSVQSASVRANPSVVAANITAASNNRSEVRALFMGNGNAPIKNIRVRFDLAGDANSVGGTFASGTSLVYSDVNGVATTSYIPGSRFSPTDGVTVRACWDYTDFVAGNCPNQTRVPVTTTLTVISDSLSVSIGSDELILLEDLVYVRRFVVQVNDSSGLAKADALVSPLLDLPRYYKGFYSRIPPATRWLYGVSAGPTGSTSAACDNEDLNRNGVLEDYSTAPGDEEDANNNGRLDPRKADVVVSIEGANRTNSAGQVKMRITYPRSHATWVDYVLTVAASSVSGTEGRAAISGTLEAPAATFTGEGAPAFTVSPYGTQLSPLVPRTRPGTTTVVNLCTNSN